MPDATVRARRALQSRELEKARVSLGITQRELAEATDRPRSTVSKWEDPTRDHLPNLADVAAFPPALRQWYVKREAAALGLVVSAAPARGETSERHILRVAECQRESGEATLAYLTALADGKITEAEARHVRKEHVDAFEKSAEVIAAMDEILFNGVA